MRRVPFAVPLRVPVLDVTERTGELVEGPCGWGERSPLPSWSGAEASAAESFAIEAATREFPPPVRDRVEVNLMVPRVAPSVAADLVRVSGCRTVKVKVGDADGEARVRAVRDALGPSGVVRLDANGAWDADEAVASIARFAPYGIELVEDPVREMDELAALHRRVDVPVAAESCVRTIDDAKRLRRTHAADAFVVKPQRIGGIRAALAAAEEAGLPTIVSSALETSVGLCAVLAVAASLPDLPYACGIGTALLLERDVTSSPLVPRDGWLPVPSRVVPDLVVA